MFFGGWHFWGLTGSGNNVTWVEAILRIVVLNVKVLGMIFFFMVARWSWARFRYDQLMSLAWLVMLPLGMVNLAYVAIWEEYGEEWARQAGFSPPVGHDGLRLGRALGHLVSWPTKMAPPMSDNRPRRLPLGVGYCDRSLEAEEVDLNK